MFVMKGYLFVRCVYWKSRVQNLWCLWSNISKIFLLCIGYGYLGIFFCFIVSGDDEMFDDC